MNKQHGCYEDRLWNVVDVYHATHIFWIWFVGACASVITCLSCPRLKILISVPIQKSSGKFMLKIFFYIFFFFLQFYLMVYFSNCSLLRFVLIEQKISFTLMFIMLEFCTGNIFSCCFSFFVDLCYVHVKKHWLKSI